MHWFFGWNDILKIWEVTNHWVHPIGPLLSPCVAIYPSKKNTIEINETFVLSLAAGGKSYNFQVSNSLTITPFF